MNRFDLDKKLTSMMDSLSALHGGRVTEGTPPEVSPLPDRRHSPLLTHGLGVANGAGNV